MLQNGKKTICMISIQMNFITGASAKKRAPDIPIGLNSIKFIPSSYPY